MSARARADAPPPDALRWVERTAGRGYRVVRTRRLTGGVETATHQITLRRGEGTLQLVLRRKHKPWTSMDADDDLDWLHRQADVLRHVEAHAPDVPAPEVVAVDRPGLLMRKLPGRIDLAPRDPGSWLQQMADRLRSIHAIPPVPGAVHDRTHRDVGDRRPPEWSAHPQVWERALEVIAAGPPAGGATSFVHGDYQHFNMLWSRGRLTGIVDWSSHAARPPSRDLGHCRLNLVILYGSEAADDFLRRYGGPVDPWWDLWETVIFLPSWAGTITRQVGTRLGRPVDADAMHRRIDEHVVGLVQSTIAG